MKLLLYSPNFYPLIGGLENVVMDMAIEFSKQGHDVRVVTSTPNPNKDNFPFIVIRQPGFFKNLRHHKWANVVIQFCISLKGIPVWWLSKRPLVVSHQTSYTNDWKGRLKYWIANKWGVNIACSQYIANSFHKAVVIPNPYNHELFKLHEDVHRKTNSLIFLGRLVSDKGVDTLIEALRILKSEKVFPQLSIIGDGPERENLQNQVEKYGLENQVQFQGKKTGTSLVKELNQHQIMIVPSLWKEPFGIVALEGLACGCVIIGSDEGGLKDAIGKAGLTFPNGDPIVLAQQIKYLLEDEKTINNFKKKGSPHLEKHKRSVIASQYLDIITTSLK